MTRNYTITEVQNDQAPSLHDSKHALQEIANILHGAGTDDEKIELIRREVEE